MSPDDRRQGRAHVGCSGWVYKDWRGLVYPGDLPQRRWFEHYATLFDTVEIDAIRSSPQNAMNSSADIFHPPPMKFIAIAGPAVFALRSMIVCNCVIV